MNQSKNKAIPLLLVLVIILFLINTFMIMQMRHNTNTTQIGGSMQTSIQISNDATEVVQRVKDSVVTVALSRNGQIIGNGSGSIISSDAGETVVLTNNHVVDQGAGIDIYVYFNNGEQIQATVLGKDPIADLAIIQVRTNFDVTPIAIGDSDVLQQGEPVIAIGSPLDLAFSGTVTQGVVSGLNRTIETDTNGDGVPDYNMNVIQTDTTINPGNSGGPLINMAGQLVGVNTSKISMEGFEGMGFSIPSNEAIAIVEQLKSHGSVQRPVLGIRYFSVASIPAQSREQYGITQDIPSGSLYVAEVVPNSAADRAGLRAEDIITQVNGKDITTTAVFTSVLFSSRVGDNMELTVLRNGQLMSINVTL